MRISDEKLRVLENQMRRFNDTLGGLSGKDKMVWNLCLDLRDARKELADIKAKSVEIGEGDKVLEYDVPSTIIDGCGIEGICSYECKGQKHFKDGITCWCQFNLNDKQDGFLSPGPDCPQNDCFVMIAKRKLTGLSLFLVPT
jgi:hypothetical protein